MKAVALIVLMSVLSATSIFFLFGRVDSAMEIDNLKEQIKLQRRELLFLQSITNSAFDFCQTNVVSFESAVRANGRDVLWQGDDALVGPFRVRKHDSCIVSIEAVIGF